MLVIGAAVGVAFFANACRSGYAVPDKEERSALGGGGGMGGLAGGAGGTTGSDGGANGGGGTTNTNGGGGSDSGGGTTNSTDGGAGAASSNGGGTASSGGGGGGGTTNSASGGSDSGGGSGGDTTNSTNGGAGAASSNGGGGGTAGTSATGGSSGLPNGGSAGSGGNAPVAGAAGFVSPTAGTSFGNAGTAGSGGAMVSCTDGTLNQDEAAIDCGGSSCVPCLCSYSTPELLGNPNSATINIWSPSLTADELSIYYGTESAGVLEQLAVATRLNKSDDFGVGQVVLPATGLITNGTPFILPDGLTLYFYSIRPGGAGERDLYVSKRNSASDQFVSIQALSELNTAGPEHLPWVSADELTIYFSRILFGQVDSNIWRATRVSSGVPFDPPELVTELNSEVLDDRVTLTADQRTAIFASQRSGKMLLYQAARATSKEPFGTPQAIAEFAGDEFAGNPTLTPDDKTLYFVARGVDSAYQLMRSVRTCP